MAVTCRNAFAMLELDHVAIATGIARVHDPACAGGTNDRAFLGPEIHPWMQRPSHAERIFPCAISARDLEPTAERLMQRQHRDHAG